MADEQEAGGHARRRELENMGTPYISIPGGRAPLRTPVGARGWDTPVMRAGEGSTRRRSANAVEEFDELEDEFGDGPSRPAKKKRAAPPPNRVRDDLTLDAFQRNYTSEDNASFVQIVDEDNKRRREDRWGWAWEAERKAEQRRVEGEERRKMILGAATDGGWMVNAEGRRLIGGLAEGGKDRAEGEAWKEERKMIDAPAEGAGLAPETIEKGEGATVQDGALVPHNLATTSGAMIRGTDAGDFQAKELSSGLAELPVPSDHPLNKVLSDAGLQATALVSVEDGAIVPLRETASGGGEGRGRGDEDRERRNQLEKIVLGDEEQEYYALGGSGADQWGFKVSFAVVGPSTKFDIGLRRGITFTFRLMRMRTRSRNCEMLWRYQRKLRD